MVGIAQLVSAPDCGSGGRRFDPGYSPHFAGPALTAMSRPDFIYPSQSREAQDRARRTRRGLEPVRKEYFALVDVFCV